MCCYSPPDGHTLLALARANGIPLEWMCTRGTCAHCAARVRVLGGEEPPMGARERNVLTREGLSTALTPGGSNWRLACQLPLLGADLRVEW